MGTVRVRLEPDGTLRTLDKARRPIVGQIDAARVDATTDVEIGRHAAEDDADAARDAAAYARRVRRRTGLTQAVFAALDFKVKKSLVTKVFPVPVYVRDPTISSTPASDIHLAVG